MKKPLTIEISPEEAKRLATTLVRDGTSPIDEVTAALIARAETAERHLADVDMAYANLIEQCRRSVGTYVRRCEEPGPIGQAALARHRFRMEKK